MKGFIKNTIFALARILMPKFAREELKFASNFLVKKINNFNLYKHSVEGKAGIEIGGPTNIFQREIPVYRYLKSLDGVNFNFDTIWEGSISEGINYKFYKKKPIGYQFISEASNLNMIRDGLYDFVVSSNCLEHSSNPIKAIIEWSRILKVKGALVLVLPKKDLNFDHKRQDTEFKTLLHAYKNNFDESDLSALDEILEHHDLERDPGAGTFEEFKARSMQNIHNRCLHHHVYSINLIKKMLLYTSFIIADIGETPYDYYVLGVKQK